MIEKYIYALVALFVFTGAVKAQDTVSTKKWAFELAGGLKVGGAAPLGLPVEIRKINSFNLGIPAFIKVNAEHKINHKWGVRTGLALEGKGMAAKANVKGYKTTFNANPSENMRGYFYGDISTNVDNIYVTVPVQATLQLGSRWNVQAGPYLSYAFSRRFYGKAIDGYLRNEVPTGDKIVVENVAYDFSESVRKWDLGASLGGKYAFGGSKNYFALAQLDYGFNNIMKTGFESISFGLHNVYMNVGFGVRL